jgi:hypothetical protein
MGFNRLDKSQAAARFAHVEQTDGDKKVRRVSLPGSDGKRYQVIIRRDAQHGFGKRVITTECRQMVAGDNFVPCKGNTNGHVCYHSVAAVLVAAEKSGHSVAVCKTYGDAQRLSRMGGAIAVLSSHQGKGILYLVIK